MHYTTCSLPFMGFDFLLDIEFTVSSLGYPSSWDDPGAGPEFDILSIFLSNDDPDFRHSPPHKTTGKLFQLLAYSRQVDEAILSAITDL